MSGTSPTMAFTDTTSGHDHFWLHVNSNNFYILADRDGSTGAYGQWETPYPLQLEADTNKGYLFGNEILYSGGTITAGSGGSASAPIITFSGDTNTGIFRTAADQLAFSAGGVSSLKLTTTQVEISDDLYVSVGAGISRFSCNHTTSQDDWAVSPISIRERGLVGSAQSAKEYAPNLNFHWASRVSRSLTMLSNGNFVLGEWTGSGSPQESSGLSSLNLGELKLNNTIVVDGSRNLVNTASVSTSGAYKIGANVIAEQQGTTLYFGDRNDNDYKVHIQGFSDNSNIVLDDGFIDVVGDFDIAGSLSKNSGSFKIDHPLKPETHHLVHSFVEGPQADNLYRGVIDLHNGRATIDLDEWFGMTPGTFLALNRDIQAFVNNADTWDNVRAKVMGSQLVIECQNPESNAKVSWLVIGERQDKEIHESSLTDDHGKVIVEPQKVG